MKQKLLIIITAIFILTNVCMPLSAFAADSTPPQTAAPTSGSTWTSVFNILNPLTWINAAMELIVLPLAGLFLYIAGALLDFSILYSLQFATRVSEASSAIVLGWTIIRDVFNMLFIFVIIWVAIATMLDINKWSAKQMLTKIIIAAILINFSFFLTEIIIDAGNIFGAWFYNGIQTTLGPNASISAALSSSLGIWNLTSGDSWKLLGSSLVAGFTDPTSRVIAAYIRLGVIAFATYIFVYVAILFFARTISLMFSLILSPVGFAGSILPQTKEYADEWWSELIKNVLLAPVFLLFLYIIIAFVNSSIFTNIVPGNSSSLFTTSGTSAFNPTQYFQYFLLAGMLLYALKAAKKFSGSLGKSLEGMAKQIGGMVAGVAVGVATGGASLALSSTIGALGSRVAGSDTAKNMIGSKNRAVSILGSSLRGAGTWTSKQTFDAGKSASGVLKGMGAGVSIPKFMQSPKEGYVGRQKAIAKRAEDEAKFVGPNTKQIELLDSRGVTNKTTEVEMEEKIATERESEATAKSERDILRDRLKASEEEDGKESDEYKALEKELVDKEKVVEKATEDREEFEKAALARNRLNTYSDTVAKGTIVQRVARNVGTTATAPIAAAAFVGQGASTVAAKIFEGIGFTWGKEVSEGLASGFKETAQQATPFAQTASALGIKAFDGIAEKQAASQQVPDENLAKKIRNIKKLREEEDEEKLIDKAFKKAKERDSGGTPEPKPKAPEDEEKPRE